MHQMKPHLSNPCEKNKGHKGEAEQDCQLIWKTLPLGIKTHETNGIFAVQQQIKGKVEISKQTQISLHVPKGLSIIQMLSLRVLKKGPSKECKLRVCRPSLIIQNDVDVFSILV